jgi:hypothetical protein
MYLKNPLQKEESSPNFERERDPYEDIDRFAMQYGDKLCFYDILFEYMENLVQRKKIKFSLERNNPQSLGLFIELILKDWLKCKKDADKYKKQLKQLIIK